MTRINSIGSQNEIPKPSFTYDLIQVESDTDDNTVFQLESTTVIDAYQLEVKHNSCVRLKHWKTNTWVHWTDEELEANTDGSTRLCKIGSSTNKRDSDAFKLVHVPSSDIRNVDFASDISEILHSQGIKIRENRFTSDDKKNLDSVLTRLIYFLTEALPGTDPLNIKVANPNRHKQALMRDLNILEEIWGIMRAPFVQLGNSNGISLDELKNSNSYFSHLLKLGFRIIKHSQELKKKNQVHYILDRGAFCVIL